MILYIAGPMTGLREFNYPEFHRVDALLRRAGHQTINPARHEVRPDWTWADYMRHGIRDVTEAQGLALLDGWERSKGATLERDIADALALPVKPWRGWVA